MSKIQPIILAGGSGTRLWPLSRQNFPKQFSKIIGTNSLFQETLLRFKSSKGAGYVELQCNNANSAPSSRIHSTA